MPILRPQSNSIAKSGMIGVPVNLYSFLEGNLPGKRSHLIAPIKSSQRHPYFLWDQDLTEADVWASLQGDNEYERIQITVRILESARWDDIWRYLTLAQVRRDWPQISRRLRPELRDLWGWAMEVWDRDND